jgi:hypothetical protein
MRGDFTRQTFRGRNHYRGVLQQQGRVQLDADFNEQVLLQAHLDRLVGTDTIGVHGTPVDDAGMAIVRADGTVPDGPVGPADLWISPGHYYADGILCENDAPVPLGAQPDLPGVPLPEAPGAYSAYLDVWHEHVTAIEKAGLREVALGGPDTATRMRTLWQVRIRPAADPLPVRADPPQLAAQAEAPTGQESPCDFPSGRGYQRLENQLYRVEIHSAARAGAGATFVWSRENGSVTTRPVTIDGDVVTVESAGRDDRLSFGKGWIEVIDTARARRGEAGFFAKIESIIGTDLTVTWSAGPPPQDALGAGAVVRRWESDALAVEPGTWQQLESGVEVQFRAGTFRVGDYWLIPARTANLEGHSPPAGLAGDVDWPREGGAAVFEPPAGVRHAYADIAGLVLDGGKWTVTDRRHRFRSLTALADEIVIGYAGGDAQQVLPGDRLPQPLEVSARRGGTPVPGVRIRFAADLKEGYLADSYDGALHTVDHDVTVPTGADGIARAWWRPVDDPQRPGQRVTAWSLDAQEKPFARLVEFSAAFGLARDVFYDPGTCARLAGTDTVQAAIDDLARTPVLTPLDGDGQDGRPGADLAEPVRVQVRTGCGDPVAGATVRFSVTGGAVADAATGLAAGKPTAELGTDGAGSAVCWWRLGDDTPVQTLTAALLVGGTPDPAVPPVTFVAGADPGSPFAAGPHVTGMVLDPATPLANDVQITVGELVGGLAVLLDERPDDETVNGKPVLTVTLDLPYPFADADVALWGAAVVGTVPLTLAGGVSVREVAGTPAVDWSPTGECRAFLGRLFEAMRVGKRGDRVLGRVTLAGRAITGNGRAVNGLTVGRPAGGRTEWVLPSVDDVRGADFAQWFWLVDSFVGLVLVPRRSGRLEFPSARAAIAHAVSRDDLRARLRAGASVTDGPGQDIGKARTAAGHAFRKAPDRRLTLVVSDRYADAANVLRDAAAEARIDLDVIVSPDEFTEASTRLAAGDPVDGVLTDDAALAAAPALADFPKGYPL